MTIEQIAAAFNEWMRRYTEDPQAFEAEFQTVTKFLADGAQGTIPSYGEECAAYLQSLVQLAPVCRCVRPAWVVVAEHNQFGRCLICGNQLPPGHVFYGGKNETKETAHLRDHVHGDAPRPSKRLGRIHPAYETIKRAEVCWAASLEQASERARLLVMRLAHLGLLKNARMHGEFVLMDDDL